VFTVYVVEGVIQLEVCRRGWGVSRGIEAVGKLKYPMKWLVYLHLGDRRDGGLRLAATVDVKM
jgi:hypothetical protein